jgi:hypothetical protein
LKERKKEREKRERFVDGVVLRVAACSTSRARLAEEEGASFTSGAGSASHLAKALEISPFTCIPFPNTAPCRVSCESRTPEALITVIGAVDLVSAMMKIYVFRYGSLLMLNHAERVSSHTTHVELYSSL